MNGSYAILTNNSRIDAEFNEGFTVLAVIGNLHEFYNELSCRLQNGYKLISSPLPANVPLIRSPIRSVILEKMQQRYDTEGLQVVEKARERSETLGTTVDVKVLPDLEMIDKDQLGRAIRQLDELSLNGTQSIETNF